MSSLQYQGRVIYGEASNEAGALARTMLALMIVCMRGGPTFCFKLLPVRTLDADFLQQAIHYCYIAVENAGGRVLSIVSDNHRTN